MALEACAAYVKIAEAWGLRPQELAHAWARDRPYNAVVVTGTTTVRQCRDACRAFRLEPLPKALNDEIDAVHEMMESK